MKGRFFTRSKWIKKRAQLIEYGYTLGKESVMAKVLEEENKVLAKALWDAWYELDADAEMRVDIDNEEVGSVCYTIRYDGPLNTYQVELYLKALLPD